MKGQPIHQLPESLPPELRARLRAFDRRVRLRNAVVDLAGLFLVTAGLATLVCGFDRLVDVPGAWRLPFTGLTGLAALALAARFLFRFWQRPDYDDLAHQVDQAAGDARGHLRSVLDFCRRKLPADSFAGLAIDHAQSLWKDRPVGSFVDYRPLRRLWGAVALVVVLGALWQMESLHADLLLRRFLNPLGNYMRPTATWFEVEALPAHPLSGGDDFVIRAQLRGRPLVNPRPLAYLTLGAAPASVQRMQAGHAGVWELPLRDVRKNFEFQLVLGPARSAVYRVAVSERPVIETINVTYQYPLYTRWPERKEVLTSRTITALEGTKAKIELVCNIPLQSVTGSVDKEQRAFLIDPHDPHKAARFQYVSANERLDLLLRARNGLDNSRELPLNIRMVPDSPPVVVIANDPGNRSFFPNEIISLAYKAQDDIGLGEITLVTAQGEFIQAAEVDPYGAKELAGTIRLPVSSFVKPGVSAVQLRVTALDTKGQRSASPLVTIKIAANSYDRQLRKALHCLTGTDRSGNDENSERLGFPALARQTQKLQDLRSLNAKITVLRELLNDGAPPGAGEQKQVDEVRGLLAMGGPVFPYLAPPLSPGYGGVRAIDVLGRAPMTIRLRQIVRDAACGAELAVSSESLTATFAAALRSGNPKAELANVQIALTAALARQEQVTQVLSNEYLTLNIELAGYLATTLDATLRGAGKTGLTDNEARGTALAQLKELAALLDGPLADQNSDLGKALAAPTELAVLAQAQPLLKPIADRLAAAAVQAATQPPALAIPIDDYLRAFAPAPGTDWAATYALWLDIQTGDTDANEDQLLSHALAQLHFAATGKLTPPNPVSLAGRQLQRFATLSRFAEQAGTLRVNLVTHQSIPGQPSFEPDWLRLRELAFTLHNLMDPAGLQTFTGQLALVTGWLPDAADVEGLPLKLAAGEGEARRLALALLPAVRSQLQALVTETANWSGDLADAIDRYRAVVAEQMALLEKTRIGSMAYQNLPGINNRLSTLMCAVLEILDIREAARLNGAVPGPLNLEQLVAVRVALQKAQEDLQKNVGAPLGNMNEDKNSWKGKTKAFEEHGQLIAGITNLLVADLRPEVRDPYLNEQVIRQHFDLEQKAVNSALAIGAAPAATAAALLANAGTDKLAAPVFWGNLVASCFVLRQAVVTGNRDAVVHGLTDAQKLIAQAVPLPREARSLSFLQDQTPAGLPADGAARNRFTQEMDGILDELRPLALPPPVFPDEERSQQQQLAVWQARFQRAAGPVDNDALRVPVAWALTDLEWNRRKHEAAGRQVGISGLPVTAEDEFTNLKLPKYLYLELKRAREGAMPELFKDRSQKYLSTIMEKAR